MYASSFVLSRISTGLTNFFTSTFCRLHIPVKVPVLLFPVSLYSGSCFRSPVCCDICFRLLKSIQCVPVYQKTYPVSLFLLPVQKPYFQKNTVLPASYRCPHSAAFHPPPYNHYMVPDSSLLYLHQKELLILKLEEKWKGCKENFS